MRTTTSASATTMSNSSAGAKRFRWGAGFLVASALIAVTGCGSSADDSTPAASDPAPSVTDVDTTGAGAPDETSVVETSPPETVAVAVSAAPDASPYVIGIGDISGLSFPDGEPGTVSVVAVGSTIASDGSVPIVLRNNTPATVGAVNVAGTARDEAGSLVGSGSDQGLKPVVVAPGEIVFGYVYFDGSLAGSSPELSFDVTANEVNDYFRPVTITELNNTGDQIIGVAVNNLDVDVAGPIRVDAICFDVDGTLLSTAAAYLEQDLLTAGGTGSFAIDLYGDICPVGLAAAGGY